MRTSIVFITIAALVAFAVVLFAGSQLLNPDRALLSGVEFSPTVISPNADGDDDVALIRYELSENAIVSIYLEDEQGTRRYFRQDEIRASGKYEVQFSGVVDGYVLPGEEIAGEVLRRLIPNGNYTWTLLAVSQDTGEELSVNGQLQVVDGNVALPEIVEFTVFPDVFTPNQDGIADRTQVNVGLAKDSDLQVFLLNENDERIYMARREEGRDEGEAGRHWYDYEGGVDIGADPPPDGDYTVVAVAQDAEGQVVRVTTPLTIQDGGKPRAEIMPQPSGATVIFEVLPYEDRYFSSLDVTGDLVPEPTSPDALTLSDITMPVGDLLVFKLTVNNYGPTPIRTSGPWPGTVYQQDQPDAALGWLQRSGVWRVGIQCETSVESYPWRWAIGSPDVLQEATSPSGETFYYLPPGEQSVTWGAIRMTDIVRLQNPQRCWAGLIHEDVEVSQFNTNVGARLIELVDPNADISPDAAESSQGD